MWIVDLIIFSDVNFFMLNIKQSVHITYIQVKQNREKVNFNLP